jgi:uncharacterized protein
MLLDSIKIDIQESLKKGDKVRVETLRFLLAAIRNLAIAKYGNKGEAGVTDTDVLDVVKKQAKTHKESIVAYQNGNRNDLVVKEQDQLTILLTFLPKELSDDEIRVKLEPLVAGGEKNFGMLMKQAMAAVEGQAEGGRVSAILKQLLS